MWGTSNAILGKLGEQARGATWSHIVFFTKLKKIDRQKRERTTIFKGTHEIHCLLVVAVRVRAQAGKVVLP